MVCSSKKTRKHCSAATYFKQTCFVVSYCSLGKQAFRNGDIINIKSKAVDLNYGNEIALMSMI